MKNKLFLPIVILLLSFCFSCDDRDDNLEAVNIRIKNTSSLTYDTVQVGEADMQHTAIAPDAFSEYLEYETAYNYASIIIEADGQTYTLQPIDYVGETPLPLGFYTYELNIIEESNGVELTLVVD
ncbi:hypothetical protein M4I21_14675 [Cellulophaga sp. 20_2_10]|uniref:hypothetical protein n=1 Tax=Cellulophaga sp. 20_2_10 TaxID=2942476 RepID=UPI00201AE21D|nr:hypothetical protein [Cellulophaga sp. 20_2_10]MCL5247063.1 hypothetical protein [Cellulophaga sp. 20_2_10]